MKNLSLLTLLTFINVQVAAQFGPKYLENSNSLLWEISGNGLKDTSYLFGTYHFAGSSFLDTLPMVNNAFRQAETIVGEVKMGNEVLVNAQLVPHMEMDGHKLDKLLSAEEFELVNQYLIKVSNGLHLNMFNKTKPAAIQMVLISHTSPVKPAKGEKLMDLHFQMEGEKLRKEIIGLETIAEQGKLLFGLPIIRQKKLLLKFVNHAEKQEELARELFEYYRVGDLESLQKGFTRYNYLSNEEMDNLIKHRNKKWMKKLPGIMKRGSSFIAVGAGHLIGRHGLITLLKEAGYNVRPINTR